MICCFSETLVLPEFSILKGKKIPPNKLLSMLCVNKPLGQHHFRCAFCYVELLSWSCLELFGRWDCWQRREIKSVIKLPKQRQIYSVLAAGILRCEQGPCCNSSFVPVFTIFCNTDPLLLPGPLSLRSCRSTLEVTRVWKSVLASWRPFLLHVLSTGGYSLQGQKCSWWWRGDTCECTEDGGARQYSTDFITQRWVVS